MQNFESEQPDFRHAAATGKSRARGNGPLEASVFEVAGIRRGTATMSGRKTS